LVICVTLINQLREKAGFSISRIVGGDWHHRAAAGITVAGVERISAAGPRSASARQPCVTSVLAGQLHANDHRGRLPLGGWQFNPVGGVVNPAGVGDADEKYYMYYADAGIRRPVANYGVAGQCSGREVSPGQPGQSRGRSPARWRSKSISLLVSGAARTLQEAWGMGWAGGPPSEWSSYIFNEALLARGISRGIFLQGHMIKIRRPGP